MLPKLTATAYCAPRSMTPLPATNMDKVATRQCMCRICTRCPITTLRYLRLHLTLCAHFYHQPHHFARQVASQEQVFALACAELQSHTQNTSFLDTEQFVAHVGNGSQPFDCHSASVKQEVRESLVALLPFTLLRFSLPHPPTQHSGQPSVCCMLPVGLG
jgi:hypothetical protein